MRISSVISGSTLVLLLALAGCGGDDSGGGSDGGDSSDKEQSSDSGDSGSGEKVDVCGLLSASDLEAAFGSPFDDGEATHLEQTGGDQCVWGNTDAPPVKVFSLTVMREGELSDMFEEAGVTVESLHDETRAAMPDAEDIDLGDDAYLSGSTLAVLDGDTSYSFSTTTGTSAEAIEGMKSLAEQVVG